MSVTQSQAVKSFDFYIPHYSFSLARKDVDLPLLEIRRQDRLLLVVLLFVFLVFRPGRPRSRRLHRPGPGAPSTQTLIIISTVLGAALLLAVALAAYFIVTRRRRRRKQQSAEDFKNACLRDPDLTWDEYARRTKLTRSRILLAEEELRDTIIRKSLQDRSSSVTVDPVVVVVAAAPDSPGSPDAAPVSPPPRTRNRTWHGRNRSKASIDAEEGEGLLMALRGGDWTEHEARVERTWQLLHKKYPTRRVTLPVEEEEEAGVGGVRESGGGLVRPPTIRLKTPPLLSHPMFRGWRPENTTVRHTSLPTELGNIKPAQI
ncbi:transcription factor TFIIB [Colletotrichum higginsianum]|nr:transcription factor TFIIB [Colletotrichum higginsianum]